LYSASLIAFPTGVIPLKEWMSQKIDFTTLTPALVVNSHLDVLQQTNSTTGVAINQLNDGSNVSNLKLTLVKDSPVLVLCTFPLSSNDYQGIIDLYIDGVIAKQRVVEYWDNASSPVSGYYKTTLLTAGEHKFEFKLKASASSRTAYLGAYRTISVVLLPIPN